MQMERLMRHCEHLADTDLLGNPAYLQHALELAIQFPNAGKHDASSRIGSNAQTQQARECCPWQTI